MELRLVTEIQTKVSWTLKLEVFFTNPINLCLCYCSVAKSCPTLSYLMYHLKHTRLPCPSLLSRVCSNLCPLSQWCHPTISSSVTSFYSCPQVFPASGSFPVSWLFALGGQSNGASTLVLPMNIQGSFPLESTGLISLLSKGLSRVISSTTVQKHSVVLEPIYLDQIHSSWFFRISSPKKFISLFTITLY